MEAQQSQASGESGIVKAKPPQLDAQPAVLRATIQITRKATGKVETYEIVGTPQQEQE